MHQTPKGFHVYSYTIKGIAYDPGGVAQQLIFKLFRSDASNPEGVPCL